MSIPAVPVRRAVIMGAVIAIQAAFSFASPVRASESDTKDPVDIVVLVDESASLSSAAVRSEKDALKEIIGSSEIEDRGIRVGVLPFSSGSSSPRRLDNCSLTEIEHGPDSRSALMKCADEITRQRRRGSADTDFAAAITNALDTFDRSDASRIILLLTDGKYDPDGNESVSSIEQEALDAALKRANDERVSMWALGFGKADKAALTKYVESTAMGDPSCAAKPEAKIAAQIELASEIRRIIDHATCTGRITGSVNPDFEFPVSPLLSRVTIEVSSASGNVQIGDVSVKNANGDGVCASPETDRRGRWTCIEQVSGQDGGTWKVSSAKGKKLMALVTWNGSIEVVAQDCVVKKSQSPKTAIVLDRSDGLPVNFDINANVNWPQVVVRASDPSGVQLRKVDLTLDQLRNEIAGVAEFPLGTSIDIQMSTDVPEAQRLLVRAHQISSCTIVAENVPTTTSSPAMSSVTTIQNATPPTTLAPKKCPPDCPPPPPPYWLYALMFLVAVGVATWYLRRRGRRFPDGSELAVRNRHNMKVFDTVQSIAGKSAVYFDVSMGPTGAKEVVVVESKSDARYVLTRHDSESIAIESLFGRASVDNAEDEAAEPEVGEVVIVLNDEVFNPRESDPAGSEGKSDQIFMRVNWPEPEDEYSEEDE